MPPCVERIRNSLPAERRRVPSHPGVLGPAEQVARRTIAKHLRGQRQRARRARRARVTTSSRPGSSESNGLELIPVILSHGARASHTIEAPGPGWNGRAEENARIMS